MFTFSIGDPQEWSGFLDACIQASSIVVPFLDTLVTAEIRDEESKYILSPKGIYLLQLFADLHPIFAYSYLHRVDSDHILLCEVQRIAIETANTFDNEETLPTPLANALYDNISTDDHSNIIAIFDIKGKKHRLALNTKVTRSFSIEDVKAKLVDSKRGILKCMADNIRDQNDELSLSALMSAFDLLSEDDFDTRAEKVSALFDIFGTDSENSLEKWNGFEVKLIYQRRLKCTKPELQAQFQKTFIKMNTMTQDLKKATEKSKPLTQKDLWKPFLDNNEFTCPMICRLVKIMFSIPPNTGWVERAYSILEMICQKRRNKMSIETLAPLFFLGVSKMKVRDSFGYDQEIKNIVK